MTNYDEINQDVKRLMMQLLDAIIKLLPSKSALYYKEQIAKLSDTNSDLKEEIAKAAANSLNGNIKHIDFQDLAKQVAVSFMNAEDRIKNGDKDFSDLLKFCDIDKMLKDAENKYKDELIKNGVKITIVQKIREEHPLEVFDEHKKEAIVNQLVSHGYIEMINYFDANKYLQAALDGKIDLGVRVYGSTDKGIYIDPDYNEHLGDELLNTINYCEKYINETVLKGGNYEIALESSKAVVKDELHRIYVLQNIKFDNINISQDDFYMYGDMQMAFPRNGKVWFFYDLENGQMEIHYDSLLDEQLSEFEREAISRKAYDLVDEKIYYQEIEKSQSQENQEIQDDEDNPYGERKLPCIN